MDATTDPTLRTALARLEEVATAAGLDGAGARHEGEVLAAAVSESSSQAFVDWAAETGHEPSAEAYMRAAQQGRRWRGAATSLLSELVLARSPHAGAYAQALAEVCTTACLLGRPSARVLGNAQSAAAAQLEAARTPTAPQPERPAPGLDPTLLQPTDQQEFARRAPEMLNRVLSSLQDSIRRQNDLASQGVSGSSLDLDPFVPLGPGAFPGLPGGGAQPSGTGTPASPDATAPENVTPQAPPAAAPGEPAKDEEVEPEPEPKSLEELLAELDALTGLKRVKEEIHKQAAMLRVEGLRAKQGLATPTVTRHLVFVGNPGTGKTTVARLVAGIYRALGLLSKGQLVEVDRSELVAGYLGQTAIKTAEVVKSAEGGVLFIDEAYSLSGDQYGVEAINTLVKEMEDKRDDLVVIVAGYPLPMQVFIAENPGLQSRFRTTIEFDDYTDDELVGIFRGMVDKADFEVDDASVEKFRSMLAEQDRGMTFGNGRFARNVLEAAIGAHAWRLRDIEEPTVDDLRRLVPDDLDVADDEDELPDLAAHQPAPGQPLVAPEGVDEHPPTVDIEESPEDES
ncbi:hypothetical protein GCM10027418_00520 [Mariniluteicoccus endophyticus]